MQVTKGEPKRRKTLALSTLTSTTPSRPPTHPPTNLPPPPASPPSLSLAHPPPVTPIPPLALWVRARLRPAHPGGDAEEGDEGRVEAAEGRRGPRPEEGRAQDRVWQKCTIYFSLFIH